MIADQSDKNGGFSDILADVSDSDVVIELVASAGARKGPELSQAQLLEDAVEASYSALAGNAQVQFERVAVMDEVARRSLSVWLRVQATAPSADGLSESEDAALLKYFALGTLTIIGWMDGSRTLQVTNLQQAMRVLAWGTSITTAARPAVPSSAELVHVIELWQRAKSAIDPNHLVRIITKNGSENLDLSKKIADPRALLLARKLVNHSAEMIFVVELPDYEGTSHWQLKHGASSTPVIVEPGTLLDKFYQRELDVRPGDALRCRVDVETSYGPDHEVLGESYRIFEVLEIMPAGRTDSEPGASKRGAAAEAPKELERAS